MKEPFTPDDLYPPDHEFGMEVPEGGSACSKCEYLDHATKKDCTEEHFIQWNGGPRIKGKNTAYCCDNFQEAKSKPLNKDNTRGLSLREILDSELPVEASK